MENFESKLWICCSVQKYSETIILVKATTKDEAILKLSKSEHFRNQYDADFYDCQYADISKGEICEGLYYLSNDPTDLKLYPGSSITDEQWLNLASEWKLNEYNFDIVN